MLGWMELLLVLVIVLIIFGAGKIPQLGEGLGKAIKGFKKSVHEPEPINVTPNPEQPIQQAQAAQPAQPQAAPHAGPGSGQVQRNQIQPEQTRQG